MSASDSGNLCWLYCQDLIKWNKIEFLELNDLKFLENLNCFEECLANFESYAEMNLVSETQPSIRILNEWILIKMIAWKIENIEMDSLLNKLKDVSLF